MPDKTDSQAHESKLATLIESATVIDGAKALADAFEDAIPDLVREHAAVLAAQMGQVVEGLSERELIDDLPEVFADCASVLRHEDASMRRLRLRAPAHGITRFAQGFEVSNLALEYALLRPVVVRVMRDRLGRQLTESEARALHSLLDYVTGRTTTAFTRQKEDQLRLQTDAMGRFLSRLAHDLRNDLNGTMMALQLLERSAAESGEATQRTLLQDIGESRRAMTSTIASMTRLLESEKLRAGESTSQPKEVSLRAMLDSVSRSAARNAGGWQLHHGGGGSSAKAGKHSDGTRIRVECPDHAVAHTDPELLSTILLNLVGNALKYASEGEVVMRVEPAPGKAAEGDWRVSVIDLGPGIAPEQLQLLFNEFDRGAERGGDGIGLGLSIVRRAAELLDTEVIVATEVGRGSTFSLLLPASH